MRRLVGLALIVVFVAGCGSGGDDGIDQGAVDKAQAPLITAAKRAGGDWSKMTEDEKKLFLDRARGNEKAAQQMAGMMGGGSPAQAPKHP